MEKFLKLIGEYKIPSFILLVSVWYFGGHIVINSNKDVGIFGAGCAVLIVAAVLTIIAFCDYRNKEYYDGIISTYKAALKDISSTHSAFELKSQSTLTSNNGQDPIGSSGEYIETNLQVTEIHK